MDISPFIVEIIQSKISKGEYRSVQEFIVTSVENQVYLIENQNDSIIQTNEDRPKTAHDQNQSKNLTLEIHNLNVKTSY